MDTNKDYKESLDKFIWDIYMENVPSNTKPTLCQRIDRAFRRLFNWLMDK